MSFQKISAIILSIFLLTLTSVSAQSVSEIKQKIDSHSDKIKQLDQEIAAYQKQIDEVGGQASSLQNAIKLLDINQKKITAQIQKTETDIEKTNLTITQLGGQIGDTQKKIGSNTEAISKSLNMMYQSDQESLLENFLGSKSMADVFDEFEGLNKFQDKVREQSAQLQIHKDDLSDKKTKTEKEKVKLQSLKSDLSDQNKILNNNKKEKNALLAETKNKESEYKKILADKQTQREQFEKELFDFESQLKKAIDPNSFPSSGKGVLSWPLDDIFITQPFGKTVDSKRLYISGTHNGVDFRASVGTPVKSVLSGTVQAVGNTDSQKSCYSYGQWVLIKHPNGLSSLYAHLSLIKSSPGQEVSTGQVIGYSGQTGYATGPHLHLTIYASQGLVVQRYSSSINCKNVTIPMADPSAYLDPMLYF